VRTAFIQIRVRYDIDVVLYRLILNEFPLRESPGFLTLWRRDYPLGQLSMKGRNMRNATFLRITFLSLIVTTVPCDNKLIGSVRAGPHLNSFMFQLFTHFQKVNSLRIEGSTITGHGTWGARISSGQSSDGVSRVKTLVVQNGSITGTSESGCCIGAGSSTLNGRSTVENIILYGGGITLNPSFCAGGIGSGLARGANRLLT
jgi:hypothetical protein